MKTRPTLVFALLVASVASSSVVPAAAATDHLPGKTTDPTVWLQGAFGRVLAGPPEEPAGAHPEATALDTFLRHAPLKLDVEVPLEDLLAVTVVSRTLTGSGTEEQLSSGATAFEGPDLVGQAVITATVTTAGHGTTRHAWLVSVPDREGDLDSLFEITPPAVDIVAESGQVAGVQGNGCFAYLCSETGGLGPPDALDALRVGVGETLAVRTEDGSGLAGWSGRLTPLGLTHGRPVKATGVLTDTVESMLSLPGLEATAAGEWLLELRVDFDRERGRLWHAYRLIAE